MEDTSLNQLTTFEQQLEQKGEELWQAYPLRNEDELVEVTDQMTVDFWQQYTRLIDEAQQHQLIKNTDKALVLAEDTFLSNQQQFKSVVIPLGKYFYKRIGMQAKMKRYLGLAGAWVLNFMGLGAGLVPPGFQGWVLLFQIGFGAYITVKLVNTLTDKTTTNIHIEPSYIRDKTNQLMLAFKDIHFTEETDKGLLVSSHRMVGKKQVKLLIPKTTEEYNNLSHFIKQIVAINEQQPNVYPNLPAVKDHHWASPVVEFTHNRFFVVPKQGMKSITTMPLDWTGAMLGIGGASAFAISFFGIPMFGLLGALGAFYVVDLFREKKRFCIQNIQITQEHLQYTFSYNHKTRTLHIPLKEIYGLHIGRRGIKVLNARGDSYWQSLEYPHKKYEPIIPKKMPELLRLQVFLEEVVAHNRGLS